MASDETGVTYIWDVSDLECFNEGEEKERGEVLDEDEELLQAVEDPRDSIKALTADPLSLHPSSDVDSKASIKALSTSPPSSKKEEVAPSTPQTPPMSADKISIVHDAERIVGYDQDLKETKAINYL